MTFWTFMTKEIYSKLMDEGIYEPDFSRYLSDNIATDRLPAYNYILEIYNAEYNTSSTPTKGLIFGHIGIDIKGNLNTIDDLYALLSNMGYPSGTYFPRETHVLLKVEVPDNIKVMMIDFYRFTDLIYFSDENNAEVIKKDNSTLYTFKCSFQSSREYLFQPNASSWELLQGHIPFIKKEWIAEIHEPRQDCRSILTH